MKKVTAILVLAFFPALIATSHAEDSDWEYKGEKRQVKLHWRAFPNSSIPEFRATTVIDASMASVLGVLLDIDACTEWVHQCKRAFLVAQPEPNRQIIYQVNSVPFATDRDIVMAATLTFEAKAEQVTIEISSASNFCQENTVPACEEIRAADYVRVEHLVGQYRLRTLENGSIEATWQQHLELGGNLPAWIVRGKLDDLAYETLRGLGQQAQKPQYKNLKLHIENDSLSVVNAN